MRPDIEEHALRTQLAVALKARDEALAREAKLAAANKALAADVTRCAGIESALAAANARADAAEQLLAESRTANQVWMRQCHAAQEALAAARRENGLLKRIAQRRAGHGHDCATCRVHVAEACDVLDDLAAPGDSK